MKISKKIKGIIQAEIKSLESLKKSLQKQAEQYDVNNGEAINKIVESINYYKDFIDEK